MESVADSNSGGGALFPTAGISFAIVLVVFVRCGFRLFSCCLFLYSSVVSFPRLLRASRFVEGVLFSFGFPLSLSEAKRGIAEENARVLGAENVRKAREERSTKRVDDIVYDFRSTGKLLTCCGPQLRNCGGEMECFVRCRGENIVDVICQVMTKGTLNGG